MPGKMPGASAIKAFSRPALPVHGGVANGLETDVQEVGDRGAGVPYELPTGAWRRARTDLDRL